MKGEHFVAALFHQGSPLSPPAGAESGSGRAAIAEQSRAERGSVLSHGCLWPGLQLLLLALLPELRTHGEISRNRPFLQPGVSAVPRSRETRRGDVETQLGSHFQGKTWLPVPPPPEKRV